LGFGVQFRGCRVWVWVQEFGVWDSEIGAGVVRCVEDSAVLGLRRILVEILGFGFWVF